MKRLVLLAGLVGCLAAPSLASAGARCTIPSYGGFIKSSRLSGASCATANAVLRWFVHHEVLGHSFRFRGQVWQVWNPWYNRYRIQTDFRHGRGSFSIITLPYGG